MRGMSNNCATITLPCDMANRNAASSGGAVGRRAWIWTEERRKAVQADVSTSLTAEQIGEKHGLSERCIENAFERGILHREPIRQRAPWKRPMVAILELIDRNCGCCGKPFKAETKFLRRCETCRVKSDAFVEIALGAA